MLSRSQHTPFFIKSTLSLGRVNSNERTDAIAIANPAERYIKGEDTRPLLAVGAKFWEVDISEWSDAEKKRSHGDGIKRFGVDCAHNLNVVFLPFY